MASITIKKIPDDLYHLLKDTAHRNGRSMNSELIIGLKRYLLSPRPDREEILDAAREFRKRTRGKFKLEQIRELSSPKRSW